MSLDYIEKSQKQTVKSNQYGRKILKSQPDPFLMVAQ